MPKSRPPYASEFRRQIVELVRAGRPPEELAREFEPSAQTIRNLVAQAARDAGGEAPAPCTRKMWAGILSEPRHKGYPAPTDAAGSLCSLAEL